MGGMYYHRSDRKLIVVVLVIIAILIGVFVYLGESNRMTATGTAADSLSVDSARESAKGKVTQEYYAVETSMPKLFYFDPNTADSTQLLSLGLQPWQVRNIYKYRAKGGVYRKPTDFARLYGLTVKQYKAIEPYIRISSDYLPASTLVKEEEEEVVRDTVKYPVKISNDEYVVLNRADTAQLKRVPGIGSWYAKQIVRYGNRLGGYVDVGQLAEIEGFPEEALQYFAVEQPSVTRLNLNRLTLNEMSRHPYIGFYRAKAIIDYRRLYGKINSLDDLKLNKHFTPEAIEKLKPYVMF
jgi:DNA uptake protein ComE-like DNA-binding protein